MTINYNIEWSNSKLDGKLDFHYWELLMVTHLRVHNIWSFVESGLEEGANVLLGGEISCVVIDSPRS